jgi:hypothetical protein
VLISAGNHRHYWSCGRASKRQGSKKKGRGENKNLAVSSSNIDCRFPVCWFSPFGRDKKRPSSSAADLLLLGRHESLFYSRLAGSGKSKPSPRNSYASYPQSSPFHLISSHLLLTCPGSPPYEDFPYLPADLLLLISSLLHLALFPSTSIHKTAFAPVHLPVFRHSETSLTICRYLPTYPTSTTYLPTSGTLPRYLYPVVPCPLSHGGSLFLVLDTLSSFHTKHASARTPFHKPITTCGYSSWLC